MGADSGRDFKMIAPLRWLLWTLAFLCVVLTVSWLLTMPGKDIRGIWATDTHGLRLDIGRGTIDIYEVTDISCYRARRIPANAWLIRAMQDITLTRDGNRLRIDAGGGLTPIMARRTNSLPPTCPQTPAAPGSAQENFDVLWHAMAGHYAFFDVHDVDWPARRAALRPSADAALGEAALFDLLQTALAGLDDGQVTLRTPAGQLFSPATRPDWFADRHLVRDATLAQVDDLTQAANTGLLYGWAAPGIGYVYLAHLDTSGGFNTTAKDQADIGFAEIARAFSTARGIILDARYTPGGADDVALTYARFFTDRPLPVLTTTIREGQGFSQPTQITLDPRGASHLHQPTIILTSGFTAGAADVFTLIMRELPQVTLMGTHTSGAQSAVLSFSLPNGWQLGLPHRHTRDAQGAAFAKTGITPDMIVPVDVAAARAGRDTTLDRAISVLAPQ